MNLKEDKFDNRDFVITGAEVILPQQYQIPKLPMVRSQGSFASCASFAIISAYEIQQAQNKKWILEGSERFHYYNARTEITKTYPNYTGMSIRESIQTANKFGYTFEMLCPYSDLNEKPNQMAYAFSKLFKVQNYYRLYDKEAIKQAIHKNMPVICGIYINNNFNVLNNSDYLYKPKIVGGSAHAVIIVGFDDDKQEFIIRNSWSRFWGNRGYFRMSYNDFIKYSFDWWIMEV